jgi:hypothetical protein
MEATPKDAALYFVERFNHTWRERDLGDLPVFRYSENPDGSVNLSANKNGQSPLMTINHTLVATGRMPEHAPVDLQDGDQFYGLIDRFISDVY